MYTPETGIESVINGLNTAFGADGARLVVESFSSGQLVVRLILDDVLCSDCVLSGNRVRAVILAGVQRLVPDCHQVLLLDPREDAESNLG